MQIIFRVKIDVYSNQNSLCSVMWLTEHSSRSESDVQKLIKYVDIFKRNSEKKILTSPRHCFFCMQDYALKPKVFNQKIIVFNIFFNEFSDEFRRFDL